jgi:hypothetical protein
MAAATAQSSNKPPKGKILATYDYTDDKAALLYQVVRLEPKDFRQRRPDGNGGWTWNACKRRVLYRWSELAEFPDATVFVTEGEKDADRVASLGHCSTTVACGKWTFSLPPPPRQKSGMGNNADAICGVGVTAVAA